MAFTSIYRLSTELGVKSSVIVAQCRKYNLHVDFRSRVTPAWAGLICEWFADTKSFQNKTPVNFRFLDEIYEVEQWNEILTGVCSLMAKRHPDKYEEILLSFRGRRRYYFSRDVKQVDQPKQIPGTGIYAMTKLSAKDTVLQSKDIIRRFAENPNALKISAV